MQTHVRSHQQVKVKLSCLSIITSQFSLIVNTAIFNCTLCTLKAYLHLDGTLEEGSKLKLFCSLCVYIASAILHSKGFNKYYRKNE